MAEFFGIRHLSPAGAFELRKRLDEAKPDIVLVEGPSDMNDFMQWICHKDTRFPIALMAYTNNPPINSILYPFAVYSPEVQAILWAKENNVECRFMDLPSGTFLAFEEAEQKRFEEGKEQSTALTTESVYHKLEIYTGEAHDSFWERNFEHLAGTGTYQSAAALFGKEIRKADTSTQKSMAETLVRESFMKRQIQNAEKEGKKNIFCVCGAFHVSGIESVDPMTDEEIKLLPRTDSLATVMPYSYFRLSSMSGYGAGNKAPSYYELLWKTFQEDKLLQFAETYLVSVASEHRKSGNIVSSAEVIEAARLSKTLSRLRGSKYPVLDDLHDAAVAAMGHGNFSELVNAFVKVEVRPQVGTLPEGVTRTSIQDDFYRELEELGLKKYQKETAETLELDLRENLRVKDTKKAYKDLSRSFFFTRLSIIGVKFASGGYSSQDFANWKEVWNIQWTPETEIEVVEASLLGETVAGAAAFKLKEMSENATTIDEASDVFHKAFLAGLPECALEILKKLENLSVDDAAMVSISRTALNLSNIIRFGSLRHFESEKLVPLLEKLYLRFCLIVEQSCNCGGDAVSAVIESIETMSKVQLSHDFLSSKNPEYENMLVRALERISNRDDLNPKCSGFAMAILLERGVADEELLSKTISRRISPGLPADLGALWFEGLSAKNHYSLISRLSLWKKLAEYVDTLDDNEFKRAVVFLRRAFADYLPSEKIEISENLAQIWDFDEDQLSSKLTSGLTQEEKATLKESESIIDSDGSMIDGTGEGKESSGSNQYADLDDFNFDDI